MGVFDIRDQVDDFFEKDPFELMSFDTSSPRKRKQKFGFYTSVMSGFIFAIVMALGIFWFFSREHRSRSETPYAYFELRVMTPEGRPLAGATVREGKKNIGVTDSFGEWRRFMRVQLGGSVLFQVEKKSISGFLAGSKNIAIPPLPPKNGDLEIKTSIQVEFEGHQKSTDKKMLSSIAGPANQSPGTPLKTSAPVTPGELGSMVESSSSPPTAQKFHSSSPPPYGEKQGSLSPDDSDGGGVADSAAPHLGHNLIWFEFKGQGSAMSEPVIQALTQRSLELGFKVSPQSPLKLTLLEHQIGPHRLLQVNGRDEGMGQSVGQFSFLRSVSDTPLQTARDILWMTANHVKKKYQVQREGTRWRIVTAPSGLWSLTNLKVVQSARGVFHTVFWSQQDQSFYLQGERGDPCDGAASCFINTPGVKEWPPVAGWQLLAMRVYGGSGNNEQVFVSGYEVQKKGKELVEFWGLPQSQANVTVIRNGKIIFRGRISTRIDTIPSIHIPSSPVARLVP